MRLDVRLPQKHRRFTEIAFDRWLNGSRKVKQMPDKTDRLRKHVKFERIVHKCALYGPHRGG